MSRGVARELDELARVDAELKHAPQLAAKLIVSLSAFDASLSTFDAQRAPIERDSQIDRLAAEELRAMQRLLLAHPTERRQQIPTVRDDGRCEVEVRRGLNGGDGRS